MKAVDLWGWHKEENIFYTFWQQFKNSVRTLVMKLDAAIVNFVTIIKNPSLYYFPYKFCLLSILRLYNSSTNQNSNFSTRW